MSDASSIVGAHAVRSLLVGRDADLAELRARLLNPAVRLVTVTGPGGVGKTRLALSVASDMREIFTDRLWIVALAGVREAHRVPSALRLTLGLRESDQQSDSQAVYDLIDGKPALIVVDNMEQVIEAGLLLSGLLTSCPTLKLLVTSRTPLQLSGETEYPLAPLPVPVSTSVEQAIAENPAVKLFVERAQTVRPDFVLTEANLEAVREICARLDGLPLAIELAAARLKVLSPSAMLARLTHSLQLLTGGPRDAPLRLQSMRDAIGWSYDLLSASERRFFRAVGIFRSSFSLGAASAVALNQGNDGEPLDQVMALVNQSLLAPLQSLEDEPRFAMLETIREFALQALAEEGELDELAERHARWLVAAVERVSRDFFTAREVAAMESIERDAMNLTAALGWLVGHDLERAGILGHLCWYYWGVRGHYREGLEWLDQIRGRGDELTPRTRALVNRASGFLNWALGRYEAAGHVLGPALDEFKRSGDLVDEAMTRVCIGSIARDERRFDAARTEFSTALEIFDSSHEPAWAAYCLSFLGSIARSEGRYDDALDLLERGFAITKRIDYPSGMSPIVDHLGDIARERGDHTRSYDYYRQSMPHWLRIRDPHAGADSLVGGAEALVHLGHPENAARMLAAATAAYQALGMTRSRYGPAYREETIELLRTKLGAAKFDDIWSNGGRAGWEEVARSTLDLTIESPLPATPPVALTEFGLTPRELQIVDLLIEGRSNAEIGEALFISPRTAGTHVANVFAKLGVNTRSAAVGVAMRSRERGAGHIS